MIGPKAIPSLMELLKSKDSYVRNAACNALVKYGYKSVSASEDILEYERKRNV